MATKRDDTTTLRLQLNPRNPRAAAFDITNAKTGDGWHGLRFYIRSRGKEHTPSRLRTGKGPRGTSVWHTPVIPGVEARFEAGASPAGQGILLQASLTNRTAKPFLFEGYGFHPGDTAPGPRLNHPGLPIFAHSENLRYENLPHSRETFPLIRPLPETPRWYGRQGLGPLPVLVLGRTSQDRWLVEGSASQDRHTASWRLGLTAVPDRQLDYRCEYFWNGGGPDRVEPGQTLALESSLYLIVNTEPDGLYNAYIDELVALHGDRFAGPNSRLAEEPVYCTWNFGVFTNITEADCVRRIKLVAKAQQGGIFQLDHGYQPPHGQHASWGYMDAYYPDTARTWDKSRYPGGPKRIVDECKKHGLTPALWFTPRMDLSGPIARDHPDWIAVNASGKPIEFVGDLHPDYSVPAVRQFLQQSIRTIIHDWGFGGIKLDFFSWAFDAPDLAYRYGGTNVQWRRWLLNFIRQELGPRGYFLHCVSCPLGNPFLAIDGCDSFRAGGDIDRGLWSQHVYNCSWVLPSFLASGKRTWFVDLDSFMGSPEFPANERRFRSAMGYLTSGMIDISGPVEKFDAQMMKEYRLLSARCDQGGWVRVPDRAAFTGRPLPRVLVRHHDAVSRTYRRFGIAATVGLFNWDNTPQSVTVSVDELGLSRRKFRGFRARDFWTGKNFPVRDGFFTAVLQPRHHALIDVMI